MRGDLAAKERLGVFWGSTGKMSKELREMVAKASFETVREFIPYGQGRVVES